MSDIAEPATIILMSCFSCSYMSVGPSLIDPLTNEKDGSVFINMTSALLRKTKIRSTESADHRNRTRYLPLARGRK